MTGLRSVLAPGAANEYPNVTHCAQFFRRVQGAPVCWARSAECSSETGFGKGQPPRHDENENAPMTGADVHTHPLGSLEGQRILVTGGAGAVGSALIDQLIAEKPAEIVVLEKFTRG